ncbi:hypothetical protein ABZZ74_07050 [Streptomyces sp. NPDC006476]
MAPTTYDVHYTVQAAEARDRLDDRQRTAFDKGIALRSDSRRTSSWSTR